MSPNDNKLTMMVFDWPIRVAAPFCTKESLERAQLEKFRLDSLLRFGAVPFEGVTRGDDPPDFVVTRGELLERLDCAVVALEGKRTAEALFTAFMQKIADKTAAKFDHLRQSNIIIWFKHGTELPPRKTNRHAADVLLEALQNVTVDRQLIADVTHQISIQGLPQVFPKGLPIHDVGDFGFQVTPVPNWRPRNQLAEKLGFNALLHFPITLSDIGAEIHRLVKNHDNECTEHLLLVIGGPNRDGFCFPAERTIADLLTAALPMHPFVPWHPLIAYE
jgi:hypothetical protein